MTRANRFGVALLARRLDRMTNELTRRNFLRISAAAGALGAYGMTAISGANASEPAIPMDPVLCGYPAIQARSADLTRKGRQGGLELT
jgi:TAT (twin-arginine translocation) pathway signal sequence